MAPKTQSEGPALPAKFPEVEQRTRAGNVRFEGRDDRHESWGAVLHAAQCRARAPHATSVIHSDRLLVQGVPGGEVMSAGKQRR